MYCRVFPYRLDDGAGNMALDEAMLDAVGDDPATALFRTYGWESPTLSLGYFQAMADALSDPRWRDVPIIRRPTGGGAIWHHQELTYALVVPAAHPFHRPSAALYQRVHEAIGGLLRAQGLAVSTAGPVPGTRSARRPFLCFLDVASDDLVSQGAKVLGSAQRRRPAAILQHGSLLIRGSPVTPEFKGIGDVSSVSDDPLFWAGLLSQHVPGSLGLLPEPTEMPLSVSLRARRLEAEVYRNHAWNERR